MNFSIDKEKKKINVERAFAASLGDVWAAWTTRELLEQWWAPKPWRARTKTLDFKEGGHWLYVMEGPNGEQHWSRFDYTSIQPEDGFSAEDAFCDEDGNIDTAWPRSTWTASFREGSDSTTTVHIEIRYDSVDDLEKYIEMGFREGFTAALENLDDLLK